MNGQTLVLNFRDPESRPDMNRRVSCRGFAIEHSTLSLPAEYEFAWKGAGHYLAYHDLMLADGEMQVDKLQPVRGGDLRGRMTYVPCGVGLAGWAKPARRTNSFTVLTFDPELVSEELETLYRRTDTEPSVYFENAALAATLRKLEGAMIENASHSSLYMESLGLVAALEMSMALHQLAPAGQISKGGLSSRQMQRIREFIDANLANDITLDSLADLAQLSRFHFSRSFKASFGVSPIRYITSRRLQVARDLLASQQKCVSEVASLVGFGTVQQFIRVFREDTGLTPGEFRRQA